MKAGDKVVCPHCGEETFVKKEAVLDGWTQVGETLNCALCSKVLQDSLSVNDIGDDAESANENDALGGLADFLGAEQVAAVALESSDSEKQFCRDCKHFISHPFLDRCSLHEKNVNPMDDCGDFEKNDTA